MFLRKFYKRPVLLVVILVLVLLTTTFYILASNERVKKTAKNALIQEKHNKDSQTTFAIEEKSTLEDEISTWITYQNLKYGFEIKHPKDWTVDETTDYVGSQELILFGGPDYPEFTGDPEIAVYFPQNIEAAITQIGSQFGQRTVNQKEVTINGINSLIVTVTTLDQPGWKTTHVFIDAETILYEISLDLENETHLQVLNSFTLLH